MRRYLVLVFLLLCTAAITRAQNASVPLVLNIEGDIWTWKPGAEALTRLTEWGYNSDLVISPDGTQVAYYSLAQIVVEAIQREGGFGGGKLPGNLWVMDTTTGEAYRTADQPEDASFFTAGVPDKAIVRSTPMWSPDGSQLAWTEYGYPEEGTSTLRLIIFDTASKTANVVADDLPFPAGVPAAMNGDWTDAGLFLYHYAVDPNTGNLANVLLLYSPDGTKLNEIYFDETPDRIVAMVAPAMYQGKVVAAALMFNRSGNVREWQIIDPLASGATWQPAPAVPERVASLNPANSLRLQWSPAPDASAFPDTVTIIEPDDVAVKFELAPQSWISQPALSPDGKAVAFQIFDANANLNDPSVYVWNAEDDELLSVPLDVTKFVQQIIWGAMHWQIPG